MSRIGSAVFPRLSCRDVTILFLLGIREVREDSQKHLVMVYWIDSTVNMVWYNKGTIPHCLVNSHSELSYRTITSESEAAVKSRDIETALLLYLNSTTITSSITHGHDVNTSKQSAGLSRSVVRFQRCVREPSRSQALPKSEFERQSGLQGSSARLPQMSNERLRPNGS